MKLRRNLVISLSFVLFGLISVQTGHAWSAVKHVETVRFRLDPLKSKFVVHADRTGIAWFKGKSHFIAARDFSGEASLSTDTVNPASLEITVKTASLEETGVAFTDPQKATIKKELDELVLDSGKYPEITFRSTKVIGKAIGGAFEVKIDGDLSLHGVTKHIIIPAHVSLDGEQLRATGEFKIDRKDFGVNATDAFHGFVRVKHKLRFTFDIIGSRI